MIGNLDIGGLTEGAAKIIGFFKEHPALAAEMEDKDKEREYSLLAQQIALNMVETAQGVFQGGWRPFIGWVCGAAFAYNFVLQPFLIFGFTVAGYGAQIATLPELSMVEILPVLGGMLGLSINRSGDKRAGVNKR